MKIAVAANKVPFMHGGADHHAEGLVSCLREFGHEVELIQVPFRFSPEASINAAMAFAESVDLTQPNGINIDKLISLQFPVWGFTHPDHRVWIMHQHRACYELYDQLPQTPELAALRDDVIGFDSRVLPLASKLFANSKRVAERLREFNGLEAEPLYHPPPGADRFYSAESRPYIFCPSRLEALKRQDLLIEAARHVTSDVVMLIGGVGGQRATYQAMIDDHGLGERVRLTGRFSEREKYALYAHALAVFFAPFDEDYGYITLEAMLSSKPVITSTDAGGPLEFVVDGETGFVTEPDPREIASVIDRLCADKVAARNMGRDARSHFDSLDVSWQNVVAQLLAD